MKLNINKAGNYLKNKVISGVQSSLGGTHLGLRYGIDAVEQLEVSMMKKFTGQCKETTLSERRGHSNRVRLENKRMYNNLVSKVRSSLINEDVNSLATEVINHGDA